MSIKTAPLAMGRAIAATPGTPAERVAILREALAKVLADPEVGALGRKAQMDLRHIAAAEIRKGMSAILKPIAADGKGNGQVPKILRRDCARSHLRSDASNSARRLRLPPGIRWI